jgi:nucleotide-binding universal stress UspA family protein
MHLFEKILVPVDFSSHSSFAVRQGADLARRASAALVLLHVLDPLPYALPAYGEVFSPEQRAQLAVEIQKSLAALRLRAQTAGAALVESAVREGYPPEEIVRFAKAGGFDLIVMGTHGRRGLAHAVLGSVVERVLRSAPCPVLTVRAPQERLAPEEEVWASG